MGQNEVGMEGGGVLDYRINGIDSCGKFGLMVFGANRISLGATVLQLDYKGK